MNVFARLLLTRARSRVLTAVLLPACLLWAAPAAAEVTEVGGVKVGLQAVNQSSFVQGRRIVKESTKQEVEVEKKELIQELVTNPVGSFDNPGGHVVLHGTNVYAVYWDPTASYNPDWQHLVDTFLQAMGASSGSLASVFSVDAQYTDSSGKPASYQASYRAAYTDTHHYPTSGCTSPRVGAPRNPAFACLTDAQLRSELSEFIAAHGLPKGMGAVYYLLTPPGVTVCVDAAASRCSEFARTEAEEKKPSYESASYAKAICSYHSAMNPDEAPSGDGNTILYGVIPWSAGHAGAGRLGSQLDQAAYCQDGGWNPSSKPPMEREAIKARTAQEQEEFAKKTPQEQELLEKQKNLQAPHDQEPNQLGCPNPGDGECDAGLGDLIVNQIAVEQQNIVTDPLLNAWKDSEGKEATDECRNFFAQGAIAGAVSANPESGAGNLANQTLGGGSYYLNLAFNRASVLAPYPGIPCLPGAFARPQFTAPNAVSTGETIGFDGMESAIDLNAGGTFQSGVEVPTYARFAWSFGDGSPPVSGYAPGAPACETPWLSPCAGSAFHTYAYGGTYEVTLTVTDVGGNVTSVSHPVTVVGPAPPAKGGGGAGAGSGSSGSSGPASLSGPGSGSGAPAPGIPAPIVGDAVLTRTLRGAAKGGVVVRYSVNEQVAGRFEILLGRQLAHSLGISAPTATGLPAGTPAQVVIARAILVTTAGGRSTIAIQLAGHTVQRLSHVRRVSMMLRAIVRNAAPQNPATATVLSAFSLSR